MLKENGSLDKDKGNTSGLKRIVWFKDFSGVISNGGFVSRVYVKHHYFIY